MSLKTKEENAEEIQKIRELKKAKEEELKKQEELRELENTLPLTMMGFCSNPDKKTDYLLVKIKFNILTGDAVLADTIPITNRVAGKSYEIEQDNLQLMFNKLKKRGEQ